MILLANKILVIIKNDLQKLANHNKSPLCYWAIKLFKFRICTVCNTVTYRTLTYVTYVTYMNSLNLTVILQPWSWCSHDKLNIKSRGVILIMIFGPITIT